MNESTYSPQRNWQVTLAIMFSVQLLSSMGFSLVYPFLPLYVEHLGSSTGLSVEWMAGLVIAVQGFTMMLASPIWGSIADRYGRKLMIMRATFGGTIILALMGMVTNGEQLILLRALQGLVTGTVAANNALVASITPRGRMGFAMGTLQVGLWGGVALGPLLGGILADAYGFAMPFYFTAGALLLAGVLVFFFIQEDFVPYRSPQKPRIWQQWQSVMQTDGVAFVFTLRFLDNIGRNLIVPIAPLFVVSLLAGAENNHQNVLAGSVMAISSATSTFSGVYLGRLGDSKGHRNILLWSALAVFALNIPQIFVMRVWQLLVFQALAGFAMGGVLASASALLAHYSQAGNEGAVYGLDNSIGSGARAISPLLSSWIAITFGMRGIFGATALFFAIIVAVIYFYLPQDKPVQQLSPVAVGD